MTYRWILTTCAVIFFLFPALVLHAAVDINTASTSELETLTGIGEVKAQAIVDYRNTNGSFTAIEEVQNVSGIGPATFENIQNDITVGNVQTTDDSEEADDDTVAVEDNTSEEEASGSSQRNTKVYADIQVPATRVVAGMSLRFEGYEGAARARYKPSYSWNFGDGMTGKGSVIEHTYTQPGSYIVAMETERYSETATDQITITVVPAGVVVSNVVPGSDGYVEIENQTQVQVDVSGWMLQNTVDTFVFPDNTHIASEATLRLTHDALDLASVTHLDLVTQEGDVVDSYPGTVEVIPDSFYEEKQSSAQPAPNTIAQEEEVEESESQTEDLAAAGLATGPPEDERMPVWMWLAGVSGVVILASGAVFLLPKRRQTTELSADDIDIIR